MPRSLYKILLISGIAVVCIAVLVFWFVYSAPAELEVDFLDVGQGDAVLIKTPYGQNILVDGGPDNRVIKRLSEELPWWDRRIDLMILTHPHDDHVAGLIDVVRRYRVERILYTGVVHTSPDYLAWLEAVRDKNIPVTIIDRQQMISLGRDCILQIIYPFESLAGRSVGSLNNSSIVAKLVYGETSFILTGDAEIEVERELAETQKFASLHADILKAGHHGSDTSSGMDFLNMVRPEITVIQVGADNDFGHPSRRILKRLERLGAQIYRNDLDGTVRIISDGDKVWKKM